MCGGDTSTAPPLTKAPSRTVRVSQYSSGCSGGSRQRNGATGRTYHKSSERPVERIQQHTGHGADLRGAIPTIGAVNQHADPLLCNSLHVHANTVTSFFKYSQVEIYANLTESCTKTLKMRRLPFFRLVFILLNLF